MQRRRFNQLVLGSPVLLLPGYMYGQAVADIEMLRSRWQDFVPAQLAIPDRDDKLVYTESVWKQRLGEERYRVLRKADTEKAHSSALNAESRKGVYLCAGCGLPVFTSAMKFDSGTGWPSFFTSIPDVFATKRDFVWFVPRTEYHCVRCGGHHGHVFDDGPPPTGKRWCNNGLALEFVPLT